jgi:cephalosporin hydroxylase
MTGADPTLEATVKQMAADKSLTALSRRFFDHASRYKYSYHFEWLGRPIVQFPQDIVAMQEIIWRTKPDLIVETGVAHGGSLVFYASMLELLGGDGRVVGIDVEIRPHNRIAIEGHPLGRRITLIEGSSTDPAVVRQAVEAAQGRSRVLVALDSNHTHDHVLRELELYSPLVTRGSYLVVFDTVVEDMPADFFPDRPWDHGNNPKTAVHEFLLSNDRFRIDKLIEGKLLITTSPDGYLECVKD